MKMYFTYIYIIYIIQLYIYIYIQFTVIQSLLNQNTSQNDWKCYGKVMEIW